MRTDHFKLVSFWYEEKKAVRLLEKSALASDGAREPDQLSRPKQLLRQNFIPGSARWPLPGSAVIETLSRYAPSNKEEVIGNLQRTWEEWHPGKDSSTVLEGLRDHYETLRGFTATAMTKLEKTHCSTTKNDSAEAAERGFQSKHLAASHVPCPLKHPGLCVDLAGHNYQMCVDFAKGLNRFWRHQPKDARYKGLVALRSPHASMLHVPSVMLYFLAIGGQGGSDSQDGYLALSALGANKYKDLPLVAESRAGGHVRHTVFFLAIRDDGQPYKFSGYGVGYLVHNILSKVIEPLKWDFLFTQHDMLDITWNAHQNTRIENIAGDNGYDLQTGKLVGEDVPLPPPAPHAVPRPKKKKFDASALQQKFYESSLKAAGFEGGMESVGPVFHNGGYNKGCDKGEYFESSDSISIHNSDHYTDSSSESEDEVTKVKNTILMMRKRKMDVVEKQAEKMQEKKKPKHPNQIPQDCVRTLGGACSVLVCVLFPCLSFCVCCLCVCF